MKISEIITDKYKLRIPPTVYYELLADVQEVEEEQEPTTKTCKTCRNYGSHNGVCDICKDYNCFTEPNKSEIPNSSTTKNDLVVDCIDRAEVLKLMQDNWHTHNGDWAMQESMDDIRALPAVTPQEPRWIPVSERLPEKAYGCIVMIEIDNVLTGECVPTVLNYLVGYDGETWNNSDGIPLPYEVIAWMPLPKPYEPQESEK